MNKLALALFVLGIIITIASAVNGIRINEIMYDPVGSDYDYEFVELYSNETEDISNYVFKGIDFQFPENMTTNGYLVVANSIEGFTARYGNVSVEFEYKNSLSNSGERIDLLNATGSIMDSFEYEPLADEGYSLEFYNNSFVSSSQLHGTPGGPYVIKEDEESNATAANKTGNTSDDGHCDVSIDIHLDKLIFQNQEKVKYKPVISNSSFFAQGEEQETEYKIEYFIEDSAGSRVRPLRETTNTNTKTFTPDIDEMDKVYFINMQIFPECNDTNIENNRAIRSFYVINNISLTPSIQIKKLNMGTDNRIKFGETLKTTILVRRGNSSKKTVYLQVEDISDRVKLNIDSKNENEFTIPIQLDPNCDEDFSDGLYDLTIEGFDLTVKTAVNVEGKVKSRCSAYADEIKEENDIEQAESKEKKPAEIISFYTRARNMFVKREINLFARVENKNFTDKYNIILFEQTNSSNHTLSEQQIPIKGGQKIALNFSVQIGRNTTHFGLKIAKNQAVFDTKKIPISPVFRDGESGPENTEFETFSESGESGKQPLKNPKDLKTTAPSQTQLEGQKTKERAVVFDNGEGQRKKIINYLIMGLSVALNSILIWKR
ncbi:hypothetical protein GF371_02715 [Candidatus Woesearchaeota archaeon]|nr:hypothetical protein [Candidatus Woesearchaeota archaeon]